MFKIIYYYFLLCIIIIIILLNNIKMNGQQKLAVINGAVSYYFLMCNMFLTLENSENKKTRRWWRRKIFENRLDSGHGSELINKMIIEDRESFFNFTRMNYQQFELLLRIVGPKIKKYCLRKPVSEKERLLITLRFLATGDNYASLSYAFRVGRSTVHKIIKETTEAIWTCLFEEYIGTPTPDQLKATAGKIYAKFGVPFCVGAIDGKHVTIQAPAHSGSLYFNYKKQFSIVLLAVCDSDCNFTFVSIGAFGSESDGGILRRTEFGRKLLNGELELPADDYLPGTNIIFPYYIVGDEAFPLKRNIMRPYGGRNLTDDKNKFNTRITSARKLIENSFGILAARFRIFHRTIKADTDVAKSIVKSTVVLHNYIKKTANRCEQTSDNTENHFGNFEDIRQRGGNHSSNEASNLRDKLKNYINENV